MESQASSRSPSAAFYAFLGVLAALVVLCVMSYISAHNTANNFETRIEALHRERQSALATYSQKIAEAAQVPEMMRDDIVKVAQAAISGRYGEGGSKAVFQAIQESNPQVPEAIYVKLQQIVESGRDEFRRCESALTDTLRGYDRARGSFWQGKWIAFAGFPRIDLTKYGVITTEAVDQVFKAGRESGPIQLRKPQD